MSPTLILLLGKILCIYNLLDYRIAGIFRGVKFSWMWKMLRVRGKNFVVTCTRALMSVAHCIYGNCFVGKYFVVCFSTTKTTKILPPPPKNTRYTVFYHTVKIYFLCSGPLPHILPHTIYLVSVSSPACAYIVEYSMCCAVHILCRVFLLWEKTFTIFHISMAIR